MPGQMGKLNAALNESKFFVSFFQKRNTSFLYMKTLPAPTPPFFVGIYEREARTESSLLEIHGGTDQEQRRFAIHQNRQATVSDDFIARGRLIDPGHVIGQPGTTLGAQRDPQQFAVLSATVK